MATLDLGTSLPWRSTPLGGLIGCMVILDVVASPPCTAVVAVCLRFLLMGDPSPVPSTGSGGLPTVPCSGCGVSPSNSPLVGDSPPVSDTGPVVSH